MDSGFSPYMRIVHLCLEPLVLLSLSYPACCRDFARCGTLGGRQGLVLHKATNQASGSNKLLIAVYSGRFAGSKTLSSTLPIS